MPLKSSKDHYGTVAIAIHWTTAALLLALLVSGFNAAWAQAGPTEETILRVHVIMGVSVLVLTLARIAWWLFADTKPANVADIPRPQAWAAHTLHRLLYLVILVMAATGLGTIALSGAGLVLFGGRPGPLPDFDLFAPFGVHAAGARIAIALIVFHVAAALYHQFIKRDRLLARMGLGRRTPNLAR